MEIPISTFITIVLLIATIVGLIKTINKSETLALKYFRAIGGEILSTYKKAIMLFRSSSITFCITLIFAMVMFFGKIEHDLKQTLIIIVLIGNVIGWTLVLIGSLTTKKAEKMEY